MSKQHNSEFTNKTFSVTKETIEDIKFISQSLGDIGDSAALRYLVRKEKDLLITNLEGAKENK